MPTTRSKFSVDQFERVLQKLAHGIPRFHRVATSDMTLAFSYDDDGKPRRISVQIHKPTGKQGRWGPEIEYWSFSIEPKLYMTSDDVTKIDTAEDYKEKVSKFIEEIMAAEKPIARFTLSQRKP